MKKNKTKRFNLTMQRLTLPIVTPSCSVNVRSVKVARQIFSTTVSVKKKKKSEPSPELTYGLLRGKLNLAELRPLGSSSLPLFSEIRTIKYIMRPDTYFIYYTLIR